MDATLDFHFSRTPALQDKSVLGTFSNVSILTWRCWADNQLRQTLGLTTQTPGLHWPGLGTDAQSYTMTHSAKRHGTSEMLEQEKAGCIGEICPLLVAPEKTVRNALIVARKITGGAG